MAKIDKLTIHHNKMCRKLSRHSSKTKITPNKSSSLKKQQDINNNNLAQRQNPQEVSRSRLPRRLQLSTRPTNFRTNSTRSATLCSSNSVLKKIKRINNSGNKTSNNSNSPNQTSHSPRADGRAKGSRDRTRAAS